jgi:hypothetical protein
MAKADLNRIGDIAARSPTGALVGLLVSAVVLAGVAAPAVIRFRAIGVEEFAQLFAPALTAALFIERVVEVFVSIARGGDRRRLSPSPSPSPPLTPFSRVRDLARCR